MIFIDFETRSRTSIKAGASRYSLDAEVMCLSYLITEQGVVKSWRPGEPEPDDLLNAVVYGNEVFAHNATFEAAIWRNVMVPKYGWPEVDTGQWRCTMAECLSLNLPPSLENAAEALRLPTKKDMAGRRLMLKMCKPRKPTKKDKSEWHETPEQIQQLRDYCDQDVVAEMAVHDVVRRMTKRERSVYRFDAEVNLRGVQIDRELVDAAVVVWDQYTDRLSEELRDITYGQVPSADSLALIKEFLPKIGGIGVDSLNKAAVADALDRPQPPTVRRILEIRAELAKSSVKKFTKIAECIEPDGRLRGCLQYHGAGQTGRWAGRLVQLHNLPRGKLAGEQIEPCVELIKSRDLAKVQAESPLPLGDLLSSLVRSAIVAAPGKRFIIADFAGIEARGLAWAAGEDWLLDAFRSKKDAYKEMAGDIYHMPADQINKSQRFMGKTATLGCGYQMGAGKFQASLESYDVEASLDFCKTVIDAYRKKNRKIVKLWRDVERAAVNAVRTGQVQKTGSFALHIVGDWLHARLPSGRDISYYRPELAPGAYGEQIRFMAVGDNGKAFRNSTYGGKLVENLIQALCRDLLVEAMARLEKAGYPIVLHIHDEVVIEAEEGFGTLEDVCQIMSEVPAWAEGFPIDAEGFIATRYRK